MMRFLREKQQVKIKQVVWRCNCEFDHRLPDSYMVAYNAWPLRGPSFLFANNT